MLNLDRKKIEKKFHPFQKDTFSLTLEKRSENPDSAYEVQAKKILKYAPRYLGSLRIQHWKDTKLGNALKRVKKVKSVEDVNGHPFPNEWRLVLQNKFKSIQEFNKTNEKKETLAKYKAFSMMSKVRLTGETPLLLSVLRYVPGLTQLKSLYLQFCYNDSPPDILKRLNSMSKTLSSLKTMEIDWIPGRNPRSEASFDDFVENKNILSALTHLTMIVESENQFLYDFELLPIFCKRLIDLTLIFLNVYENMEVLKSLKDFENLRRITISSDNLLLFLENCTLPSSTKDLFFGFQEISENHQLELFAQPPEEILEKFIRFFDQWSHLQNLISFGVQISTHDQEEISRALAFMNLMFQRAPKFVNLYLDLDPEDAEFEDCFFSSIDLTDIFGLLRRFSDELQTIHLILPRFCSLTWPSRQDINFPKLTKFDLKSGSIYDIEILEKIFNPLRREDILIFIIIKISIP